MCASHPPPSRRVVVAAHMPSMCAGAGTSCGCRCEDARYRNALSMYSNVGCCRRPRQPPLHHVCIVPSACTPAALNSRRRFAAWQSVLADALQCQPRPLPLHSHHARNTKAHTDLAFSKWRHSLRHIACLPAHLFVAAHSCFCPGITCAPRVVALAPCVARLPQHLQANAACGKQVPVFNK
jgi:hypothetical protein